MDLLAGNPALAFCLASNWAFHRPPVKRPLRSARAMVWRKQCEIAAWLGFPHPAGAVKILKKTPAAACHLESLLYLRQALARPETLKIFSHLPRINATVIRILSAPRLAPLASPSLLLELAGAKGNPGAYATALRLVFDAADLLEAFEIKRPAGGFKSVSQLTRWHDEAVAAFNYAPFAAPGELVASLPAPPLPGGEGIQPLTSPKDLLAEGQSQHNCVGAYAARVAKGECYIYRMTSPERATLSIVRTSGGWRLDEITAHSNRPVGPLAIRQAEQWLARAQNHPWPGEEAAANEEEQLEPSPMAEQNLEAAAVDEDDIPF